MKYLYKILFISLFLFYFAGMGFCAGPSNYTPIPNSSGAQFLINLNNALSGITTIEPGLDTYTYATLPTTTGNKMVFCSDCSTTNLTCVGGGSGTLAFYTGTTWYCLGGTPGGGGNPTGPAGGDLANSYPNPEVLTYHNGSTFGTAASANTGTSGTTLGFLSGTNTYSGTQTFTKIVNNCNGSVTLSSGSGTITNSCISSSSIPTNCYDTTTPSNSFTVTPGAGSASISGTGSDTITCVFTN